MRLRFVTSIPDFMEGRVIDIDPGSQQALAWLRAGVAVAEKSLEEQTALAPVEIERAVARRTGPVRRRKRAVSSASEGD